MDALTLLLAEHPRVGTTRPELAPEPYRIAVVRGFPYIAVYDASLRPPSIVRFVHGARDLPEVLRDL
jgi:toxin ParE1/3/4